MQPRSVVSVITTQVIHLAPEVEPGHTRPGRRARVPCAATCGSAVPQVPGDVGQAGRAAYSASVAAGQPLSQRVMAERFGLSDELAGEIEQNDSYLAHVRVG